MEKDSFDGLVMKSTGSWYDIRTGSGTLLRCNIRGKLRLKGAKSTNPIAVGDRVSYIVEGDIGSITAIHERKNYIIRKSSNLSRESHILAANLDQAFLVVTPEFPKTPLEFIDRFLLSSEAYRIPTTIVLNKIDLFDGEHKELADYYRNIYEQAGYQVIETSAKQNIGIDYLKEKIRNKVSVFSGNSGVGKSTLINCIDKNVDLRTGEISSYHLKGKHTTTFYEMFELETGGFIIDTPGIKGFGLVDINATELSHYFPDIFKFSSGCKYHNCTHVHEPGCSVLEAFEKGYIGVTRYSSYLSILADDDEKHRNPF